MQLFQHVLELLRNRQAKIGGILHKAQTLIGNVEKDDGGTKHRAGANHMYIHHMGQTYQNKNEHLLEDALKAYGAGEFLVHNGAHHTRDIVKYRKAQKRIE